MCHLNNRIGTSHDNTLHEIENMAQITFKAAATESSNNTRIYIV
jgi:hypothetical protein